jgi:hypothetical protein
MPTCAIAPVPDAKINIITAEIINLNVFMKMGFRMVLPLAVSYDGKE